MHLPVRALKILSVRLGRLTVPSTFRRWYCLPSNQPHFSRPTCTVDSTQRSSPAPRTRRFVPMPCNPFRHRPGYAELCCLAPRWCRLPIRAPSPTCPGSFLPFAPCVPLACGDRDAYRLNRQLIHRSTELGWRHRADHAGGTILIMLTPP